mmetsp:Transcript_11987/g.21221  ORF Transcript_11987/g.21221 Transcript_11987/m.21221 type:complete len:222 (-) Transcript_11987:1405-2070(-)
MANCTTWSCLSDNITDETVRCWITKAILGWDRMISSLVFFSDDFQPSRVPRLVVQRPQDDLGMSKHPVNQIRLVHRQRLVFHATAANGEGVKIRDHRLHIHLCICHQEATRIHGLTLIVLVQHNLWIRLPSDGMHIHVHESWFRSTAGFPTHNWSLIGSDDVALAHESFWHGQAKGIRLVCILVDELPGYYDVETRAVKDSLQGLLRFFTRCFALVVYSDA